MLELIADIYDASLDNSHWPQVLDKLSAHHQALGAVLFYADHRYPELNPQITNASQFWQPDV